MRIDFVTLFPEMFASVMDASIMARGGARPVSNGPASIRATSRKTNIAKSTTALSAEGRGWS